MHPVAGNTAIAHAGERKSVLTLGDRNQVARLCDFWGAKRLWTHELEARLKGKLGLIVHSLGD
jgi:porphobilinogen deaminase